MNPIEKFLNTYSSNKTKSNYKSNLNVYFDLLKTRPETYFTKKRNYIEDMTKWLDYNQNKAPMTRSNRMTTIRLFLEDNDIEIPKKTWKQFQRKQKANKPITLDRIPTNQELKMILEHADLKGRALILTACSSGMRINEIMSLEPDDIDFKHVPTKVYVKGSTSKFGKARICFISDEAKNSILEWLKVRDKFLIGAINKCNRKNNPITHKNPDNKQVFPFTYMTAVNIWHRLLKEVGLADKDKTTGFYRLHIHTLRKFYKTRLLNIGIQESIVRKLMGQEDPLSNSYDRFTEDELGKAYQKGVKELLIFETSPDLTETNKEIKDLKKAGEEKDQQIKELLERIKIQEMKMDILENKYEIERIKNGKKK